MGGATKLGERSFADKILLFLLLASMQWVPRQRNACRIAELPYAACVGVVQAAGVHDGMMLAAGLLAAYERAVMATRLAEVLEGLADVGSKDALGDAALAASHLAAMGHGD